MGLSVHYSLHSSAKGERAALRLVEQMRQLALDLPFEEVGEIVSLEGDDCDLDRQPDKVDDSRLWMLTKARYMVECPWNERSSQFIPPIKLFSFEIVPGPGCEPAYMGLCSYPKLIDWKYSPAKDAKFQEEYQPLGPGSAAWRFDWNKWKRWLLRQGHETFYLPDDEQFSEVRRARTGLTGWCWSTFSKTQYASDPRCGGLANFMRCHISLITLLDRIAELPTMEVEIDDEGRYGPSKYSDDWQEARAQKREPIYVGHLATYDPKVLIAQVGDMNNMIAAMSGAFRDAAGNSGLEIESPIQGFANFEQLEFKGSQDEKLQPFLKAMRDLARRVMEKDDGGELQ